MKPVLDLNNPIFQQGLFALPKQEQMALLKTLKKMASLEWEQVYRDPGLKWEQIHSRKGPQGEKLYSFRITQKCRAVAYRSEDWLRILSLHPDHDSAY
jgi:hypothetical protein